ncbi:DNA (cytosine-5-)-methyltransferase [Pseudomonas viridiflava]|uniref:DNA (cytosine-5-)-methyltransferase n=5 Tax=Pseudomonas viridiflava TaxID=33069 RepID=UPI001F1214EB|nr:DNA (cytosine-5-)-methyltransferase [Pseudomonas viridiflava]
MLSSMIDPTLIKIRQKINSLNLSLQAAAKVIGIGSSALERHLSGEYVRSDSMAKYRLWLAEGQSKNSSVSATKLQEFVDKDDTPFTTPIEGMDELSISPGKPLNVVDLFCGCGGMSLGFERLNDGKIFRIAMALDIEAPMVRVFNDNHPSPSGELSIARQSDITDFSSEAEILGYYLDHLARTTGEQDLSSELSALGYGGITALRKTIRKIDLKFLDDLSLIRNSLEYIAEIKKIGSAALGQTSIVGFHNALKLPVTNNSYPKINSLIWHGDGHLSESVTDIEVKVGKAMLDLCRSEMRKLWDDEVQKLVIRSKGAGRGQLASAADRIIRFVDFVEGPVMQSIRQVWLEWRTLRESIRRSFFEQSSIQEKLKLIYDNGRQVTVLLGGPPCQGFSRIGRGKIRSLKEQSVHVHEDEDSVDSRNQLMHQYVLFVSALAPKVFLFENVRHFQAVVKSEGVVFDAADILAEAIESVSERGLGYAVSRRIVVASHHAVPQARERFVMAGVRRELSKTLSSSDAASWCLSLKYRDPVPLQIALEELFEPSYKSSEIENPVMSKSTRPQAPSSDEACDMYRAWTFRGAIVDAHRARPPRQDDEAFFSLLGPGKRWMDYRCDKSPTLKAINNIFERLKEEFIKNPDLVERLGASVSDIHHLSKITDGSLSLRLLLENITPQPGELEHHLLTDTYLRKRDGSHGDWLSRMDPSLPSKTIVSHMAKDTYAFVHPTRPRTLSVREAARVQSFPDDYKFGSVGLVDGFRVVGNAVPPLLSYQFAQRIAQLLSQEHVIEQPLCNVI